MLHSRDDIRDEGCQVRSSTAQTLCFHNKLVAVQMDFELWEDHIRDTIISMSNYLPQERGRAPDEPTAGVEEQYTYRIEEDCLRALAFMRYSASKSVPSRSLFPLPPQSSSLSHFLDRCFGFFLGVLSSSRYLVPDWDCCSLPASVWYHLHRSMLLSWEK